VADAIPVFPLSHVLLPGMALPLHIFEPRYRQLLIDVQSSPDEELPCDANLLSYHVAGQLPLAAQDRQDLLAEASAADRLRKAIPLLRREIRLLQSTRSISVSPGVLRLIANPN